jgi:hypothetical protein
MELWRYLSHDSFEMEDFFSRLYAISLTACKIACMLRDERKYKKEYNLEY